MFLACPGNDFSLTCGYGNMKLAEYATDRREVFHRVTSLVICLSLLLIEALDGPGFISLRIVDGAYVVPLMLIWFPDAMSGFVGASSDAKYARFFGWALLVVVPLCFHGVRWLTE